MNSNGLLEKARGGGEAAQAELLSLFASYLKMLASMHVQGPLQRRVSASDLVQDTLLEAHRDFAKFRGRSEKEFLSWLRRILLNNLQQSRDQHLGAAKRSLRLEVHPQEGTGNGGSFAADWEALLEAETGSPSRTYQKDQELLLLAEAMQELSMEHREVLLMRHFEAMPFADIAVAMQRSPGACRMLWLRAIDQLRQKFKIAGWE